MATEMTLFQKFIVRILDVLYIIVEWLEKLAFGDYKDDPIIYETGFEEASVSAWEDAHIEPSSKARVNRDWSTGDGKVTFVSAPVWSGKQAARGVMSNGAVRLMLKALPDSPTLPGHALYSAWYYIPHRYKVESFWNVFQFKHAFLRHDGSGWSEPCGSVNIKTDAEGEMYMEYNHKLDERGLTDKRYLPNLRKISLPVGEWFELEVEWKWSTAMDGLAVGWLDGVKFFEHRGIRTMLDINAFGKPEKNGNHYQWGVGNYSNGGVTPKPVTMYFDDMRIWNAYA